MKLKKIVLLVFVSILLSTAMVVRFTRPVIADGTIYIRANGSVEGTDKIQQDGNVYTFTDNINDSIVIERDNIVVDGAGCILQGTGAWDSKGINLTGRSNVIIQNMEIKAFYHGIWLEDSSNNTISGNTITREHRYGDGIYLYRSSNNTISGNNITNNELFGIWLNQSPNNTISGNTVTNDGHGIYLSSSSNNNVIADNTVSSNDWYGIYLGFSDNNTLTGNNALNNNRGIFLYYSSNNTLTGNNASNNWYGIFLYSSSDNTIFHNNFINNTQQAYDYSWDEPETPPSINIWDDGYPSGGNYWSNYNGTDFYSSSGQSETGSDGIGDEVYFIDGYNQDNYPLMGPISFFNACTWDETTYYVHIVSNSTVSDFYFGESEKQISFNVTGPEENVGFCRVAIPKTLMWCDALEDWNVTVDGNPPTYLKAMEDANHTYLYFTYSHTIHNVKITSTYVIEKAPPSPFWMQWWFWTTIIAGIVILALAVYFLKKGKPPTPTAPTLPPEGIP